MKDKSPIKPTNAELAILSVLWTQGASTVKVVNETLNAKDSAEIGYTTTLKIMQIMHEKGLVKREKSGRTHIYTAAVSEEETQQGFVDRLLENVFQGSATKLVMQALGRHKASKEELDEIKAFLDKMTEQESSEKGGES